MIASFRHRIRSLLVTVAVVFMGCSPLSGQEVIPGFREEPVDPFHESNSGKSPLRIFISPRDQNQKTKGYLHRFLYLPNNFFDFGDAFERDPFDTSDEKKFPVGFDIVGLLEEKLGLSIPKESTVCYDIGLGVLYIHSDREVVEAISGLASDEDLSNLTASIRIYEQETSLHEGFPSTRSESLPKKEKSLSDLTVRLSRSGESRFEIPAWSENGQEKRFLLMLKTQEGKDSIFQTISCLPLPTGSDDKSRSKEGRKIPLFESSFEMQSGVPVTIFEKRISPRCYYGISLVLNVDRPKKIASRPE